MEIQHINTRKWILLALVNFCIVALAGVTLRYKINFPLPQINQKNLLHAHSNFAFTGWVTVVLMTLIIDYLQKHAVQTNFKKYRVLLYANVFFAYGLFIAFIFQGYDNFSLTCMCLSIFASYFFIFFYWKDLNKLQDASTAPLWFKGALFTWGMSSIGAIAIAYLMANRIFIQDWYFGAIYFFLHFQYNGWFLFVCFGLLFHTLYTYGIQERSGPVRNLFWSMAITVVPAYILSIMWLKLPPVLLWLGNVSGFLQLLVLIFFIAVLRNMQRGSVVFKTHVKILWIMAASAFILKIVLQLVSIVPSLGYYAFGYRPIIIGYLHLSFLVIISFFILGYISQITRAEGRKISTGGIYLFVTGVIAQEIILMLQGLEALEVEPLPFANHALFYCAVVILAGIAWIAVSFSRQRDVLRKEVD